MNNSDQEYISEKRLLEFINDGDFFELSRLLSDFNPFSVLKLETHEIRHSNVMAWLLEPYESHGLGKIFLQQFLFHLSDDTYEEFNKSQESLALEIASDFALSSEWNVSVKREVYLKRKERIDIEIICENNIEKGKKFVILIENKIYSTQGKNQLENYRKHYQERIKKEKQNLKILYVYLTLDENDIPDDTNYFHFTYTTIHEILENILKTQIFSKQNEDAEQFIKFYKNILEEKLNMNTRKEELAEEIYKKYYREIDFIMAHASFDSSDIALAGDEFIEEFNKENKSFQLERLNCTSRNYFFTDSILKDTSGGKKTDWRKCAVCGYFFAIWEIQDSDRKDNENKANLYFHVEVGPFEEPERRSEFLALLEKDGFSFKKPKEEGGTYTRIALKSKKTEKVKTIEDISNTDALKNEMRSLFEKSKDLIEALHKSIGEFNKL